MADDRTLDEIQKDGTANFDEVRAACVKKFFPSKVYAYQYRQHCIEQAFQHLGFSPQKIITEATSVEVAIEMIDNHLIARNIRVEDWSEHGDKDRKGMALYKDGELVHWVSLVHQTGEGMMLQYWVQSNVKFE